MFGPRVLFSKSSANTGGKDANGQSGPDFPSIGDIPVYFSPTAGAVGAIASPGSVAGGAAAGQASFSSPAASSGATPSWISTLSDAGIKADMTAAASSGAVSEAGMAQLFTDLAANLKSNNTTLSASQFNDLKTIAVNLNVGETASAYLTYVTNALISGNAANASFTGGGAKATTLGNLAAGATATQLLELADKWFLGTDLPSNTVKMDGSSTFTVTYSAQNLPLYGSGGPSMNDINQGNLGDCYLELVLAEVACKDPSMIQSMITDNGNSTYGVRFIVNGAAEYVTVSNDLANGGKEFNIASNGLWASVVEQAYAQLQAGGITTGNPTYNYGNSFSSIGNGGCPEDTLAEVTGATQITDFTASGSSWNEFVFNNAIKYQNGASGLTTSSVLSQIVAALGAGDDVILSSNTDVYVNGYQTLVSNHALSVYGYDASTGNLEIRNPWGTETGQKWDTTFEVSLGALAAAGDTISMDNAGVVSLGSTVSNAAVSQAASLQADSTVSSFTILDSAANVQAGLAGLLSDTKLSSIAFTDASAPTLTLAYAAYSADATVLAKISSSYNLAVTGATVAQAASLQSASTITSFTISDSAANVQKGLAALLKDAKLSSIAFTDVSQPTLTLAYADYSADAAVLAKISSAYNLAVTGATTAQAASLQSASNVTSFTISDKAANVQAALTGLLGDTKLSSITLTDGKPTLTLAYAAYGADTAFLAKISSAYGLTVTGATVAQAAGLQSASNVAAFTISDSAANVQAGLSGLLSDTKLSSIAFTDASSPALTFAYAAYSADAALLSKISTAFSLTVTGAAATQAAGLQSAKNVTSFSISDSAANVQAGFADLVKDTKLSSITLTDSSKPTLALTYAAYSADTALLAKISSDYNVTVAGATVAQATGLQGTSKVTSFSISDKAANIQAGLSGLLGDTKLSSITLTDASKPTLSLTYAAYGADTAFLAKITSAYNLAVTGATVAQAADLQSSSKIASFTISDSSANMMAGLSGLLSDTKLSSIALTDASTPSFALTYAAYSADAALLAKISTACAVAVAGATVGQAAGLQSAAKVTSFTISDSAANVQAGLADLAKDKKLSSITLTDSSKPTFALTYAAYSADAALLAKISSDYNIAITGATVAQAAALQSAGKVTSFTISDKAANIQSGLSGLLSDMKLTSITLTDASTPTLAVPYAAYGADAALLAKITSVYNLAVTGATVAQAADLQSSGKIASFAVSDSAANVQAGFAALLGDTKLSSIALTDTSKPTFALTYAAYSADAALLAKISTACTITVAGATVGQAAGLQGAKNVTSFTISDSAANVQAGFSGLLSDKKLSSITLTDASTPTFALTYADYAADASLLSKISSPYNLTVAGATAAQASSLQNSSKVTSFTISDTEANVAKSLAALAGDSKLTSISLADPTQTIGLSYSAYQADAPALAKIAASNVAITGASLTAGGGTLDLASLAYSSNMTVGFSGSSANGVLSVGNAGKQSVSVALLGNYLAATFTASSDGHGGTLITDVMKAHASPLIAAARI